MIIPFGRRVLPVAIAFATAAGGAIAARQYHAIGLTLSHYDARGHLVVARRIVDSITPGWQQIGAVWLPLPHLLNAIPIQIDLFYRTGASGVAISIVSFAITCAAIAWIVLAITNSPPAAVAAPLVFALNPNVVYLQATPMTEPLLLATTTVAIALLIQSVQVVDAGRPEPGPTTGVGAGVSRPGVAFALACLTRYEAWPVTASALAAAAFVRWRRGDPMMTALRWAGAIAVYPAVALAGFAMFSRVVIGEWFVAGGFFVPENKALGDAAMAAKEVGWGVAQLSGSALAWIGGLGIAAAATVGIVSRRRSEWLLTASLAAAAALPLAAFYRGHPFRIRYMVPLMAAEAIGAGIAAGLIPVRRAQAMCALALVAVVAYELRPLAARAPMVVEAQWDRPNAPQRARVTACIGRLEPGAKIMASMGSLGHYMQETAASGFAIRDFLHEGNGDIWLAALENPWPYADWILIEEKAEGGDMLAQMARVRPAFLRGYDRACDGAGLALYQKAAETRILPRDQNRTPKVNE